MRPRLSRQSRTDLTGMAFIAPQFLGVLCFVLVPLALAVIYSFQKINSLSGASEFVGLANWRRLFVDPVLPTSLGVTAIFSGSLLILNVVVGLLLAVLLNQKFSGSTFFRVAFFSPVVVSIVAWTLVWGFLFQSNGGLNAFLEMLGASGPNWLREPATALIAVIGVQLLKGVGLNMVLFLSALQGVPKELYEAAELDGAGPVRRLFRITLPLISPTTLLVAILSVIGSMQSFALVSVLTQGGPGRSTTVLVYYLYQVAFQQRDFGYGSTLALLLFSIVLVLTVAQWQLRKKWVLYDA